MNRLIYLLLVILLGEFTIEGQVQSTSDHTMVLIPGGAFIMGKDSNRDDDYSPAHEVVIDSFLMDRHEVTNREYLSFCRETNYKLPEFWNNDIFRSGESYLDYPVIGINWFDAMKYAEWAGKRLATEAEWEYAARGGLVNSEFPNGNQWTKARARQDSESWKNLIDPVESYVANGFGLYDMGGNVWEWISDRYSETYYQNSTSNNPKGPQTGNNRVIRSGSWHSGAMCKKVYFRKGLPPNWSDFAVGFRCVKDIEKSKLKENNMSETKPKVTGIGGIFFRARNPKEIRDWYGEHLGLAVNEYGSPFEFRNANRPDEINYLNWNPFDENTAYFDPSKKEFMINYRVQNIEGLVKNLKESGVTIVDEIETYEYGKFVHLMDPEGNKIELWEPIDKVLTQMGSETTK